MSPPRQLLDKRHKASCFSPIRFDRVDRASTFNRCDRAAAFLQRFGWSREGATRQRGAGPASRQAGCLADRRKCEGGCMHHGNCGLGPVRAVGHSPPRHAFYLSAKHLPFGQFGMRYATLQEITRCQSGRGLKCRSRWQRRAHAKKRPRKSGASLGGNIAAARQRAGQKSGVRDRSGAGRRCGPKYERWSSRADRSAPSGGRTARWKA
jgi:hypothetical protein